MRCQLQLYGCNTVSERDGVEAVVLGAMQKGCPKGALPHGRLKLQVPGAIL